MSAGICCWWKLLRADLLYLVVCLRSTRSQAQLKAGISGAEAREAEEAFFRQHPHFKGCDPKLFGVTNLTTRLVCTSGAVRWDGA